MSTFGSRLKAARRARDLTQEQVGEEMGVTKTTVSSWENNRNAPKLEALAPLAKYVGIDLGYLITGTEAKAPEAAQVREPEAHYAVSGHTAASHMSEIDRLKDTVFDLQTALVTLAAVVTETLPNVGVGVSSLLRDPAAGLRTDRGYLHEFVVAVERVTRLMESRPRRAAPVDDYKQTA